MARLQWCLRNLLRQGRRGRLPYVGAASRRTVMNVGAASRRTVKNVAAASRRTVMNVGAASRRTVTEVLHASLLTFAGFLTLAAPSLFAETNAHHLSIPNVVGVHQVTSSLEYLPLAVCYGETGVATNLPVNRAQHATNLVFTANLMAGDRLFVYDHARGGYVAYVLDANKLWQPDTVYAAQNSERDFTPAANQAQAWGYGFWLYRADAGKSADKTVWLAGQVPVGEVRITLAATETKSGVTTLGKTLVGNPLGTAWNLNDTSVMDWSTVAVANDHIQLNNEKSTLYYWIAKSQKWMCMSAGGGDGVIPAGASFWYVRGKTGTSPVTVTFRTGL